jgi:Glycosyltransferase family 10 (fucosyltransferase) C-term/Exostosin family
VQAAAKTVEPTTAATAAAATQPAAQPAPTVITVDTAVPVTAVTVAALVAPPAATVAAVLPVAAAATAAMVPVAATAEVVSLPAAAAVPVQHAPVTVAVMTHHYLGSYGGEIKCELDSAPLKCHIYDRGAVTPAIEKAADALWYHIPSMSAPQLQQRYDERAAQHEQQHGKGSTKPLLPALVGFSMESSEYYSALNDQAFMSKFDLTMTYRQESDVVIHYFTQRKGYWGPPSVATAAKKDAVAYLNNNCGAVNGRNTVVQQLMQHVPVHAYGGCLYNMEATAGARTRIDKRAVFAGYKFCIAMENSSTRDYVSEKLFDALEAGCVPIYMGAPNIVSDYLPAPDAALVYDPASMTVAQLGAEVQRLMKDTAAYDAMLAWRQRPREQLSAGFRKWLDIDENQPSTHCQLCQKVAQRRDGS